MSLIITIKKKENSLLQFTVQPKSREGFNEQGLLKTVEKYYKSVYATSKVKAKLIPIGGGYTDIEVEVAGSKKVLIWSFSETIPFIND